MKLVTRLSWLAGQILSPVYVENSRLVTSIRNCLHDHSGVTLMNREALEQVSSKIIIVKSLVSFLYCYNYKGQSGCRKSEKKAGIM